MIARHVCRHLRYTLKPSKVKNPTHLAGLGSLSEEIYLSKVILKYGNYVKKKKQLFPGRGKTMG